MCGCDLFAACLTYSLVFGFIDIREILILMQFSGCDNFCGLRTAIGTGHILTTFFNTGSFFCDFSGIPIMGFCLLQFAFGANSVVIILVLTFPLAVIMITGILDTDFAAALGNFVSGVGFLAAFCANFVFFVRVIGFYLCFVIMTTFAGHIGIAGVIGGAEIEFADLTLADHDGGAVIAGSAGIALNGVEIISFGVVYETYMGKTLLEEKITLLRGITLAVLIGKTEVAGICNTGSF